MKTLEIVTFHAAINKAGNNPHPNALLDVDQYIEMIDMLFRSARKFHRGSSCTVLTDELTDLTALNSRHRRIICPIRHDTLMYDRMRAQVKFVDEYHFEKPALLLDSDILINLPLNTIFDEDFDIALTWRHNEEMPLNGGLIIVNNRNPMLVKRFFRWFHDSYTDNYRGKPDWFGDQMALRDCLNVTLHDLRHGRPVINREGCKVLMLPCEQYNYSPRNTLDSVSLPYLDKYALHFKGERKSLMKKYWEAHLQSKGTMNPICHYRAWRARRAIMDNIE